MTSDKATDTLTTLIKQISTTKYTFHNAQPYDCGDKHDGFRLNMLKDDSKKNLSFFVYPDGTVTYAFFGPISSMLHEQTLDLEEDNLSELFKNIKE